MTILDSLLLLRYNPWALNTSDITLISEYSTFKRRMGLAHRERNFEVPPPTSLQCLKLAIKKSEKLLFTLTERLTDRNVTSHCYIPMLHHISKQTY